MTDLTRRWPYEAVEAERRAEPEQFACKLRDGEIQARRRELAETFYPGILASEEIEDGAVYWFDRTEEWLRKVADFVWFESRCCDFLDFGVGLCAGGKRISLRISGPPGHASAMYPLLNAAAESPQT